MKDTCPICKRKPCKFYYDYEEGVYYKLCRSCGIVWVSFKGDIPAIECVLNEAAMLQKLSTEVFEAYTDTALKIDMKDCIIKCIVCESLSFEIALGGYKCFNKNCNFKWEE